MAGDARIVLVADLVRVLHVDAEAFHHALVAQHVDGDLLGVDVEEADDGVLGLVAERGGGPLADQDAGLLVVGGEGHVGFGDGLERGVERDDEDAGSACLLHGRHDRLGVGRGEQDALGAIGDAGLDRRDLAFVVAVHLAGIGLQVDAEFRGLGGRAFLHLDEEGVAVGLGDEAGADAGGRGGRAKARRPDRRGGEYGRLEQIDFGHSLPPSENTARPATRPLSLFGEFSSPKIRTQANSIA